MGRLARRVGGGGGRTHENLKSRRGRWPAPLSNGASCTGSVSEPRQSYGPDAEPVQTPFDNGAPQAPTPRFRRLGRRRRLRPLDRPAAVGQAGLKRDYHLRSRHFQYLLPWRSSLHDGSVAPAKPRPQPTRPIGVILSFGVVCDLYQFAPLYAVVIVVVFDALRQLVATRILMSVRPPVSISRDGKRHH